MSAIESGSKINAAAFKARLKEVCNSLLPTSNYYASDQALPGQIFASYLTTRAALYNGIVNIIDTYNIGSNQTINASKCIALLRNVFLQMGKCRKVYWYQSSNGTTADPTTIAAAVAPSANSGKWTYFNTNFAWVSSTTRPEPENNDRDTDALGTTGFGTVPEVSTNWNSNTALATATAQLDTVKTNAMIEALAGIEQQMTDFSTEWANRNNTTVWWNGNASDSSNTSNKIFWVKYWCHSNCHSNCHDNHGERSRR